MFQQVLIAARELDTSALPKGSRTWLNRHLVFTHGYGFTVSTVNAFGPDGLPLYFVKDLGRSGKVQGIPQLGINADHELLAFGTRPIEIVKDGRFVKGLVQ